MAKAQENYMDSPAASTTSPCEIDRPGTVFALLVVASVTEAMFLLLPSFIGALDDVLRLTPERTGLLGSADLAGIALATATGPWWLRCVSWRRTVLISLGTFLVVNVLCLGVVSFPMLLCLRILAGIAAGTAYAVALAGIVDTRDVARNTALLVFLQVVFAAAGVGDKAVWTEAVWGVGITNRSVRRSCDYSPVVEDLGPYPLGNQIGVRPAERAQVYESIIMVLGIVILWLIALLCPIRRRLLLRLHRENLENADRKKR